MNINFHQLFDIIDDYAVDMLFDESVNNDSYETTIHAVKELIDPSPMTIRKSPYKKRFFFLTAILVLLISGFSFAFSDRGAILIDDSNRHLIEENEMGTVTIFDGNGDLTHGQPPRKINNNIWKTSSVVKKVEPGTINPKSISEFKTTYTKNGYVTPEIMFGNGDFIIFLNQNGSGWNLKKGDSIIFKVSEYESTYDEGQSIVYYQIINGTFLKNPVYQSDTPEQFFELTAETDGEYFICLACDSSKKIALKEGNIFIKQFSK